MRRAQHLSTFRAECRDGRVHVIGPQHKLAPRRTCAGCHAAHIVECPDRGQPESELAEAQLDVSGRALAGRPERLAEPEQVAIKPLGRIDIGYILIRTGRFPAALFQRLAIDPA